MDDPQVRTLSIVFTDVERSTELLESVGEPGWLAALAAHQEAVTERARRLDGRVVKSMGDGYLVAFPSARAAVRFGLESLAEPTELRIRVGIHAGEVTDSGDDIHGRAVVKAERISAAARGNQLLVSSTVRELTGDGDPDVVYGPPEDMVLKGLDGRHVVHAVESSAPRALRVVIADDAVIMRDGVAALLRAAGLDVVAAVDDGEALLAHVAEQRPDVAIVDIRMPPTHTDEGLVAAERIRNTYPEVAVVVLSQHADPALAMRLLDAAPEGGVGYLLKDRISELDTLLDGLQRVAAGGTVIDEEVSEKMLRRRSGELGELTSREREVLGLIAAGRSNRWIADHLVITPKTLEGHISQIFLKLGLHDATDEHRRVAAVLAYLGQR